jgi:hypothetical protein
MKNSIYYIIHLVCLFLISILFIIDCKKKTPDVDIQDCDAIYNYYKDGKIKNSNCYPAKDKDMNTNIELEERRTLRQGN